jgi:hypothetical protein
MRDKVFSVRASVAQALERGPFLAGPKHALLEIDNKNHVNKMIRQSRVLFQNQIPRTGDFLCQGNLKKRRHMKLKYLKFNKFSCLE